MFLSLTRESVTPRVTPVTVRRSRRWYSDRGQSSSGARVQHEKHAVTLPFRIVITSVLKIRQVGAATRMSASFAARVRQKMTATKAAADTPNCK